MSNNITISSTETNQLIITQAPTSNVIEIITAGPQGPAGPSGSVGDISKIISGSIFAQVYSSPTDIFLIKSGSDTYFNIQTDSSVDINSNLFIIKNFTTGEPIFTISGSDIRFTTHSLAPQNPTQAGSIWFTANDFYVGLE
jgi:hypothetical protein